MSPRLPVCTPDELRDELAAVERDLDRALLAVPVSVEAAVCQFWRIVDLRRWRTDLRLQLAETPS